MADGIKRDWRELCDRVTNESDSKKLISLIQELVEALNEGRGTSRCSVRLVHADSSEAA
jgi:hypothetical protein